MVDTFQHEVVHIEILEECWVSQLVSDKFILFLDVFESLYLGEVPQQLDQCAFDEILMSQG